MQKKTWKKPNLIILYRGNPEDWILMVCKTTGQTAASPASTDTACIENGAYCVECVGTAAS